MMRCATDGRGTREQTARHSPFFLLSIGVIFRSTNMFPVGLNNCASRIIIARLICLRPSLIGGGALPCVERSKDKTATYSFKYI